MTADIGKMEGLLAGWRASEARAEALRQFRDTGGEHRLRISTDIADQVPARILQATMENGGFAAVIRNCVKILESEAETAKQEFLAEAAAGHFASGFGGGS